MSTIIQHEERVRRALKYIAERRLEQPSISLAALLDDAGARFDLSPLDQEALERMFRETGGMQA
ncbi:hypothetical protein [uncultured Mailhella sp.]|uniref:hypothetical protein n=1 Tax=uncultured Mailhella sp. TaxID=1981031 RepID=UPI00260EF913|nr:hypothetical protein [uncultured Mailhella sp.]